MDVRAFRGFTAGMVVPSRDHRQEWRCHGAILNSGRGGLFILVFRRGVAEFLFMSTLSKAVRAVRYRMHPGYPVVKVATENSLCSIRRLFGLRGVAEAAAQRKLPGDFVECGVYKGGSAAVISERLGTTRPEIVVRLFDVFSGMPEPGPNDPPEAWADVGKFVSGEGIVRETLRRVGVPQEQVFVTTGLYEKTLPGLKPGPVAFLHVDCDWYEPVKLVLETFYDAVVRGGTVVFDDYGHWSGCRKAVDEFLAERGLSVTLTPIDQTSHYFLKP